MPSLRRDPLSGDWSLLAPGRSRRPNAFGADPLTDLGNCPFCPGNEHLTPPEVRRVPLRGKWRVRVIPNLYPAVGADKASEPRSERNAPGIHEVIVESRDHRSTFDRLGLRESGEVVATWLERWSELADDGRHRCVLLFHNQGASAGESIAHPHSQIVGLPWLPHRFRMEVQNTRFARCPLCSTVRSKAREALRIARVGSFAVVAPYSSRLPFQQWIIPVEHAPNFSALDSGAQAELAHALKSALLASRAVLGDVPVNWSFHQSLVRRTFRFHWYLELIPRITAIGGFELATGAYINIVDPFEAASRLRAAFGRDHDVEGNR